MFYILFFVTSVEAYYQLRSIILVKKKYQEKILWWRKKRKRMLRSGCKFIGKIVQCLGFNSLLFKHKYMNIMWAEIIIKNQETFQSRKTVFVTIISNNYSLMQKNGYTFTIVYISKCVSVFLHQTLVDGLNDSTELFF